MDSLVPLKRLQNGLICSKMGKLQVGARLIEMMVEDFRLGICLVEHGVWTIQSINAPCQSLHEVRSHLPHCSALRSDHDSNLSHYLTRCF
eukprot:Gb_34644 [translate_table: standard]